MPIYEEKTLGRTAAAIFLAVVFLGVFPVYQLHERELRWQEGYFAAMAAEMDRVLDKISATGMDSLTPQERRFLDEVSRRKQAGPEA